MPACSASRLDLSADFISLIWAVTELGVVHPEAAAEDGTCDDEDAGKSWDTCDKDEENCDECDTNDVDETIMDPPSLLIVTALAAAFVLTGMSLSTIACTLGRGGVNVEGEGAGGRGIAFEMRCPSVIHPCCTIHSRAGSRNVGGTGLGDMLGQSQRAGHKSNSCEMCFHTQGTGSMHTKLT